MPKKSRIKFRTILLTLFSLVIVLLVLSMIFPKNLQMPIEVLKRLETVDFEGVYPTNPNNNWTLLVTGDVMLGRTVNTQTIKYKDFTWPFLKTYDLLNSKDLTLINLENPIIEDCPSKDTGMIFCGDAKHAEGLKFAGIDLASLANNHSMNYGVKGLESTLDILHKTGISSIGVKNPTYKDIGGIKVAFLGFNDIECFPDHIECSDLKNIKDDISEAKDEADLIVLMFHWGNEYTSKATDRQKELAYFSIDNGADLVLGNHPHWVQNEEIYKDKLIVYSHGNFIFDQMWSLQTRKGVVGIYEFNEGRLLKHEFVPITIDDYGQPKIVKN